MLLPPPIPSDALSAGAHPASPVPVLVIVDEGYFGQEAIQDELGPSFAVAFAEGLGGALTAMSSLSCPLVMAPHSLDPQTGDEVLSELAAHRFDFVGLLLVDDDTDLVGPGVNIIMRRPMRPGALAQHVRAAALTRHQLLASVERRDALSRDIERLRDGLRHDMRGHLQSVIGLGSLLLEIERPTRQPDDETIDFLNRILASAERLNRYVDHVGDWLHQSRKPLERAYVDLGELVGEVVAEVRAHRNRKVAPEDDGLRIATPDVAHLGARVPGDARALGLAVKHMVEHAYDQGVGAEITLEPTTMGWAIRVRDFAERTLPPSHRARALNLFERAAGGTGVQLAVVAKVAERHGGLARLEAHPERGHWICLELPGAEPRRSEHSSDHPDHPGLPAAVVAVPRLSVADPHK